MKMTYGRCEMQPSKEGETPESKESGVINEK